MDSTLSKLREFNLGLSAMWDLLTPRKWLKAYKNEIQTGSESLNSKPHPSPNSQVVMDLYWRKIVGWALAKNMAVGRRKPRSGLIHHSDWGIQYTCDEYRRLLQSYGMISSMSRSGNCLDNAVAERFFHTFKTECLGN
jgi:transposase InsO family protein